MKGASSAVFEPTGPDDGEADEEAEEEVDAGGVDTLLGNAFDAFQDSDREGFVRSMRAAMKE